MTLHCVFDFDGTLMDTTEDIARALNYMRRERDLAELPEQAIRRAIGHGAEKLFAERLSETGESPEELLAEFRTIYRDRCTENLNPFPGMEPFLRELADDNTAIVTNKPKDLADRMLEAAGWSDWFDPIFGKDSLPESKPEPLPLKEVARRWSVPSDRLIMIGDSWSDVEAGKRIGAVTVGCDFGMGEDGSPARFEPDYLVRDVEELRNRLQTIRTSMDNG